MTTLLTDHEIVERVLAHAANRTTDTGDQVWREPVENYRSLARFEAENERVLRRMYTPFCPSAALATPGAFIAREAAGRPILAVRGDDGVVRAFHNVCRHRGMRIAPGSGCARAFVCGYHGWTYQLDGRLRHIPHAEGFPGLDKTQLGLVPLNAVERHGLVFISQSARADSAELAELPDLLAPDQKLFDTSENTTEANWKIVLEGFLEGYHIRATHPDSFLPYGFDNLNVVETFGRNSRVTFPFQRISKLAEIPKDQRRAVGYVTFVYQIFPNALITVLSNHTNLIVLEPLGVDRTRVFTYTVTNGGGDSPEALEAVRRDIEFVNTTGALEDRAIVSAIQRGVGSNANECFVFGRYESAIVHLHRMLDAALGA
jgi:phenylpropionate dioxygenase-like ring-hydroxylating dioxygenase large terminal subunit